MTNASDNACGFAYIYSDSGLNVENCFYNSELNDKSFNKDSTGITGKSSTELKGLASALGGAFQDNKTILNNGYPILDWQYIDPKATCTVTFNVNPKNSVLTWKGEKLAVREDGRLHF